MVVANHPHASAIAQTIDNVRRIVGDTAIDRARLQDILAQLVELASHRAWWGPAYFAAPDGDERQARHLIAEDDDRTYALYLNVMRPGKKVVPHNHTTWACIAAVEGVESNAVYTREDGGTGPGPARLTLAETVLVRPGTGIALMPDDIHSVSIDGEDTIRHLHLYGRALETLDQRLAFDIDAQTCAVMTMNVATRR